MRLQIMEMIQTRMKKTATESLSVNFQLNKGSGESKGDDEVVEEEDAVDRIIRQHEEQSKLSSVSQLNLMNDLKAEQAVPSFDEILSEVEGIKSYIAESASKNMSIGILTETQCALIPVQDQDTFFHTSRPSKHDNSTHASKGALAARDMEELSKSLLHVMRRRLTDEQMLSKLVVKSIRMEEQLAEQMVQKEEADQEHGELLSSSIELQILRDESIRLRAELATAQVYVNKFEELRKEMSANETAFARKLAEKQKQIDFFQVKGDSKGLDSATSKIHELQHHIATLTGDRDRLLKENNRITNALTVSDKRVKSALLDHVTLHQRVHAAEDELAASRTHISRLEREMNSTRRVKVDKDELTRKVDMMQKEIEVKDASLVEAEEISNQFRRQKAELAAADMHIGTLEEKVSTLSIEAEKGAIAAEQLRFTRENLQEEQSNARVDY